jgi:hypothetical protein
VDLAEIGTHTALGAALGPLAAKIVPGLKIKGISSGRNSAKAVGDAAKTKVANGTIGNVSATTAAKAAAGTTTNDSARTAASDKVESKVAKCHSETGARIPVCK